MATKQCALRVDVRKLEALAARHGSAGKGIQAAIDAYLATPADGSQADQPAGPEIPIPAPAKAHKAKADPPALAVRTTSPRPNPALCARCERLGVASCPACRTRAG